MASTEPFGRLVGTLTVYIAPAGEAEPAVNATPAGNWIEFGATDGEQSLEHTGDLVFFRDNDHQGPVKAVRPEEDVIVRFTIVNLTLENYARILSETSKVTTAAGPNSKKLPFKRGHVPTEYALLLKGSAESPYGNYPAHYYIPRCVQASSPTQKRARGDSAALECAFQVLEDDTQAAGDEMGWMRAQTS